MNELPFRGTQVGTDEVQCLAIVICPYQLIANVFVGDICIGCVKMLDSFIISTQNAVLMKNGECLADVGLILIYSIQWQVYSMLCI